MKYPKIYIGPMSKNVVDAILDFSSETGFMIGFIPSRRQVEYNGGYVNNWSTKSFSQYVNNRTLIKRDHSGPSQGYVEDDGYQSLRNDCEHFDCIHIDPWKRYASYEDGLRWTLDMINFCYKINPKIEYEVGTEEAIRKFSAEELDLFVEDLHKKLNPKVFNQIKFLVVQSGTSLEGTCNTGSYDKQRLLSMVQVCRKWSLISKEHNGDYIPSSLIKEKMSLGLDSINIAPEFGLIETQSYLDNGIDRDKFWNLCYDSKRWEKWVGPDFNPFSEKEELIKICGHYVLSKPEFLSFKVDIDLIIKENIKRKLHELF